MSRRRQWARPGLELEGALEEKRACAKLSAVRRRGRNRCDWKRLCSPRFPALGMTLCQRGRRPPKCSGSQSPPGGDSSGILGGGFEPGVRPGKRGFEGGVESGVKVGRRSGVSLGSGVNSRKRD